MSQVWLQNNRRLLMPMSMPALLLAIVGIGCCLLGYFTWQPFLWLGGALVFLGLLLVLIAGAYLKRPRLSYDNHHLIVHLGLKRTEVVPIEVVECFFMGQAPSHLPGPGGTPTETATVVVRLAEKATQWQSLPAPKHLVKWEDSYIIVRGLWCEPIDMPLLERLNRLLAEAHRQQKQTVQAES